MQEAAPDFPRDDPRDGYRWFVTRQLPWLCAFVFLLIYLVTLNRWVSIQSLETISRVCGWVWKPELLRPVTYALHLPLFALPDQIAIVCMNLASAVFGALTLALLARSVVLWPRPARRMRSEHKAETLSGVAAVIPPLLSVVVCGLQLSFWEHATAGTGEMLELMLLAYVIRCVLEYRRDHHDSWLFKAALVFCGSISNSWFSLALLPLFLGAVIAVKGTGMLNAGFASRFAMCAAGGLSFYFMWPLVHSVSSDVGFWEALKANLKFQKQMLALLKRPAWIALTLSCVAPLVAISIRWRRPRSNASDDNPTSILFSRGLIHLAHIGLMVLGLWMALGAAFSPRHLGLKMGAPLLPLHYFTCLVVGYCAGYVLLIRSMRTYTWASNLALGFLGSLAAVMVVALTARNLPEINKTNGPHLRQFARNAVDALDAGRSVVLSDESAPLLLLRAELAVRKVREVIPVESRLLHSEAYRAFLSRAYPGRVPEVMHSALTSGQIVEMLDSWPGVRLHYLHPSFGYYFERFRLESHHAVHRLEKRSNEADPSVASLDDDEAFWQRIWEGLLAPVSRWAKADEETLTGGEDSWVAFLKLATERNRDLLYLCGLYSRELNSWGVRLQRHGQWDEAGKWFKRALDLRPRNSVAALNLAYNETRNEKTSLGDVDEAVRRVLNQSASLDSLLRENGPVDVPAALERSGRVFLAGGNYHQAADAFGRCLELESDRPEALAGAAQALLALGEPRRSLTSIERALELNGGKNRRLVAIGLVYRIAALKSLGQATAAHEAIKDALARYPGSPEVLSVAAQLYMADGRYKDAVSLYDKLLQLAPENPELLSAKGTAEIFERPQAAVEMFSRALALSPTNQVIRLNRAVASLKAGLLDDAEADYKELSRVFTNELPILFGLAEVAWRRNDRGEAAGLYNRVVALGNTNALEHQVAIDRLRQAAR